MGSPGAEGCGFPVYRPHGAAPAASMHLKKQQGAASTTHPGVPLPPFAGSSAKCISKNEAEFVYQTACVAVLVVSNCVCLYFPAYQQKLASVMQLLKRQDPGMKDDPGIGKMR